ncbi:MAG TPA: hypothetical protein VIM26_26220 [Pengzhenrongella sp.]
MTVTGQGLRPPLGRSPWPLTRVSAQLGPVIATHVHAIDPDLSFETGAGRVARHLLVVAAAGNPDVRDAARRWLAAAPFADDAFEYADARQPVADPAGVSIAFEDHPVVDLASAMVVTTIASGKIHLAMSHPAFASLPDDAQAQISFLFLDALLGEEAVERWIGEVTWTPTHSARAVPLLELPALIDRAM